MFARAVLIGFVIGFAAILLFADGRAAEPVAAASAIPGSLHGDDRAGDHNGGEGAGRDRPGTLQVLPHPHALRLPRPVRA